MRFLRWLWDYLLSITRSRIKARARAISSSLHARPSSGVRALVRSAKTGRVVRLAEAEGVRPSEIQDAIGLMVETHPMTREEIIDLVEEHGLAQAVDYLEVTDGA